MGKGLQEGQFSGLDGTQAVAPVLDEGVIQMTTTLSSPTTDVPRARRGAFSLSLSSVGLIAVITAAWGAIIPYIGPTFGFSADGSSSWYWSLSHTTLALIPGAVAFVMGWTLLVPVRGALRRVSLGLTGTIIVACGAWFVIGPVAWPVLTDSGSYFVSASPLQNLAHQVGYSLGPGLILAACGAFAMGWAARHRPALEAARTTDMARPSQRDLGSAA